jgi:hypothetical protein
MALMQLYKFKHICGAFMNETFAFSSLDYVTGRIHAPTHVQRRSLLTARGRGDSGDDDGARATYPIIF